MQQHRLTRRTDTGQQLVTLVFASQTRLPGNRSGLRKGSQTLNFAFLDIHLSELRQEGFLRVDKVLMGQPKYEERGATGNHLASRNLDRADEAGQRRSD